MYSVVLMMALTGSGDVPAFGHRNGCYGGCNGYYGCNGCYGGYGCYGYGGYGYGCYGSYACGCWGGGYVSYGCYGGYGYGCSGGVIYQGAEGAVMPDHKGKAGEKPSKGKRPTKGKREKVAPPKGDKGGEEALAPAPATIFVSLPAEAKLTIDGTATQSTSATRAFASPALEPGQQYYYTLKAEIVRDGKTVSTSRRVAVRAGEETRVRLEFPVQSVAQK